MRHRGDNLKAEAVCAFLQEASHLARYVREDTSNQCGCMDNVWTRRIKACSKSYSICAWEDLVSIITRGFVSHLEDCMPVLLRCQCSLRHGCDGN